MPSWWDSTGEAVKQSRVEPPKRQAAHDDHTYLDPTNHSAVLPPPILTSPNGSHYINRGKGYNSAPFNIKVDWEQ